MGFEFAGFLAGALAACGAVTFTNPWEVVKTRLQLQGELRMSSNKAYGSALGAFYQIASKEGIYAIQKGLFPAYLYQICMNGTRLGIYEPLRDAIKQNKESRTYFSSVASGALSGILGAFVSSPFFLVKTRMQSFSTINSQVGHQHDYVNQGTFRTLKHIYQSDGIRGLWRGADAAMVRTGIGSSVQLSTYDLTKSFLESYPIFQKSDKLYLHFSASLVTSFFVCMAMNPFDVASTRMYNQKSRTGKAGGALYKNGLDCIVKTVKSEGFSALYKGLSAHYLRIGPHTILTFVFLEQLKLKFY